MLLLIDTRTPHINSARTLNIVIYIRKLDFLNYIDTHISAYFY